MKYCETKEEKKHYISYQTYFNSLLENKKEYYEYLEIVVHRD